MARLVVVLILLGVVTTVAVAWGLMLDVHGSRRPMRFARAGLSAFGEPIGMWRRDSWGGVAITLGRAIS
jgi:hypothetical protein